MSQESKIMGATWGILAAIFISFLLFLRMADNKIHALENKLKEVRQFCIGKENRLDFCQDLLMVYK